MWNQKHDTGTSLTVHWLRLCASNARGTSSVPDRGNKIPHAAQPSQKIKKKRKKKKGKKHIYDTDELIYKTETDSKT